MNKKQLFDSIRKKLIGLPQSDIDKSLEYYEEIIQDRMEEGLSEEESVAALGSMDEIVTQIFSEAKRTENIDIIENAPKKFRTWEIVLLILGSPIWFSLLIAAFAIIFAFYITIWSVIFALYATNFALAVSVIGGLTCFSVNLFSGNGYQCVFFLGASLICTGLSVLMFLGLSEAIKGVIFISKKLMLKIIKLCSFRRGNIK